MKIDKSFERLPTNVKPLNYTVTLKPDFQNFTFEGTESVKLVIHENNVDQIVLNCVELEIQHVNLIDTSGNIYQPESITLNEHDEIAIISFPNPLPKGDAHLEMSFHGILNDQLKGFYRSKYINAKKEECYAAVTQFESTDARRAFPCWDEPALKATFNIILVVPKELIALSNMPIIDEKDDVADLKLKIVTFDTSPKMSTYLVAVVIGEFDFVEDYSKDGVLVRVYTPVGKKEQGLFSLHVATKVLPFYKDFFQIAYPLPKLDLVAIPDFSTGAMENWGLVTYRETCLLVDPTNTSTSHKQWVALVVGHELAHQWFGNLVTMEWWTHLWLNEGYATFVEFLCVDYLFPEYDIWTQFAAGIFSRALEFDGLHSSHAIEVPVEKPSEINEIFDDISYDKGACVIRMLYQYLGDKDFRKGMNLYLTKYQYSNTYTEDLWAALEEASNKPVGKVMSTWTKQQGYPLIHIECQHNGVNKILTLKQERFYANGSIDKNHTQWIIPVNISTKRGNDTINMTVMMERPHLTVTLEEVSVDSWIKLNSGAIGFYRVKYPSSELDKLMCMVKNQQLSPLDRFNLADDLFSMAQAGQATTVQALQFMKAYIRENNFTVWCCLSKMLEKLYFLFDYTDMKHALNNFARYLLTPIAKHLTWTPKTNDSHQDTLLRSLILRRLGLFEDIPTIVKAKDLFEEHFNQVNILPADLRGPVYSIVAHNGNANILEKLIKLYKENDLQEEKDRIGRVLGNFRDSKLQDYVLKFAMSDDVRAQDTVFILEGIAVNKEGRELIWNFFCNNRLEFVRRYAGNSLLMRMLKSVLENFASHEKADEIEIYFQKNPLKSTERAVNQAIENIRLNANWINRDIDELQTFFKNYQFN